MKINKLFTLPSLIFISFIIYSCGNGGNQPGTSEIKSELAPADTNGAVVGDWVIKREMSDAEKLNPIVTNDATAEGIYTLIYESLNDFNYESYEQIPRVASLPEISPDLLTYTYIIDKNAKWSDGKPVTAEDIIFTMKAIKNPFADDAALRNYYENIAKVEMADGDMYKVRMTMIKPYWLAKYYNGDFSICPKHILDPNGLTDKYSWDEVKDMKAAEGNPAIREFADFLNSQEVSRQANYVVGSGPYMLEEWKTGQNITLKRNANYWKQDRFKNYPDRIVYKIIQDNSAAIVAAKNKEVDVMAVVQPVDFYKNLENAHEFNLVRVTPSEPSYTYFGWNNKHHLFSDKKVRLAMGHLIDRKSVIDKISFGKSEMIQSPVYYKQTAYLEKFPEIEFNLEKGKQLLKEAGWIDSVGNGVLDKVINGKKTDFKFTFLLNTNPTRQQTCLIYIDALKKVGIQADIQQLEWSVFLDKTKKHEFEATMGAWVMGVTPPDLYQLFHSSQSEGEGSNYCSYKNEEVDRLLEEYRFEAVEANRIEKIKRIQRLIYEDQPYTFLWTPLARYVYDTRFRNTRFYAKRNSPMINEWWVPAGSQKYKTGATQG